MHQRWTSLLFAHWPVPPDLLRPLLPASVTLDTYEGQAWVGIIPFHMSNVRPRWVPPLARLSSFHELNVRTYVRVGARAGVWFFSLDASSAVAVRAARAAVHLPYYDARMRMSALGDGSIAYLSERTHRGAPAAAFEGVYRPDGDVYYAEPGSLDHFLVERYELFSAAPRGLLSVRIAHRPWPLHPANRPEYNGGCIGDPSSWPAASSALREQGRCENVVAGPGPGRRRARLLLIRESLNSVF
jgi:uncharacterized protein YqjF (DUF2071 family)